MATKELTPPQEKTKKSQKENILIIGLGNFLMGDEGIGVHIAQRMELMHLEPYIKVADMGTGGFKPLQFFESFNKTIFVDAVMDGQPTGTISHIRARGSKDFEKTLSMHDSNFREMLQMLYSTDDHLEIHLITVSIDAISPMYIGLSEDVDAAIDRTIWQVIELAETLHNH